MDVQRWPEDRISTVELRTRVKLKRLDLVIQKQWMTLLGLANVDHSRLIVESPQNDQGKQRMR